MKSSTSINSSVKKTNMDPFVYFQPGEMVYLVKHKTNSLSQNQIRNLFQWSNDLAAGLGLLVIPAEGLPKDEEPDDREDQNEKEDQSGLKKTGVQDSRENRERFQQLRAHEHRKARVYSFSPRRKLKSPPRTQNKVVKDGRYESPQVQMPTPFTLISADVIDRNTPRKFVKNDKLATLILRLDANSQGLGENPVKPSLGGGASLEVVSFNWLMGASSESGGTGGPGARPVPFKYESPQNSAAGGSDVMDYPFNILQSSQTALSKSQANEWGKGVKVAILDTAPSLHDLVTAYERWHKVNPERDCKIRNALIESLLKPDGPLTVHPATYNDLIRMRSVHLREHNYKMTDHGLFVAGIIHQLAPAAEIHLYEVLNADGVGDLESIAKGLWEVFDQFEKDKRDRKEPRKSLVVNCSLVLNIPFDGHQITELDPQILAKIVKCWKKGQTESMDYLETSPDGLAWLKRQGQAIQWICDLLYLHDSRVIAAAGNDWKSEEKLERPHARFLAAFDSVFGVGALPKVQVASLVGGAKYNTASYSNISDEPGYVGVTTFGGEGGEKNGVLGLYIGEFPIDPNPPFWRRFLNWIITLLGGRVTGPKNPTDIAWWAGTSFATPIVAGTIAAVLSSMSQPATTEDAIREAYKEKIIREDQTVDEEDALDVTQ